MKRVSLNRSPAPYMPSRRRSQPTFGVRPRVPRLPLFHLPQSAFSPAVADVVLVRPCCTLAFIRSESDTPIMTQKKLVLDAISDLPDEASLDEIAERVEFLAAIQKGIDQLDRGEGVPHEEVKRQLATWLTS